MADASTIGASFHQYRGDPALGGGGLGAVRLDTRPIEDFGRYVMLRNKVDYDQEQKNMEKVAEELADFTALDLSTTIPKHAQILQTKYDDLYKWVQQNPDALKYNIKDEKGRVVQNAKYLEYKKKKADLMNDIKFAKMNSILNAKREEQIANEPNEKIKEFLRGKLQGEIDQKDIREMIGHAPKYDLTLPDWGQNKGQGLDVMVRGLNDNTFKKSQVFDVAEAAKVAELYKLNMEQLGREDGTETGIQKNLLLQDNGLMQGADIFNDTIASAMQTIDKNKTPIEQEQELRDKLKGLSIMNLVNQFNGYMQDMRDGIKGGRFSDEFGNRLSEDDYRDLNFRDGISPQELSILAQFAGWEGDKTELRQQQTNNDIEMRRLALGWANYGLDKKRLDESSTTQILGAQSVLSAIQQAIKTGTLRAPQTNVRTVTKKGDKVIGDKTTSTPTGETFIEIADANLLKNYATIQKDGSTGVAPNAFFYNPKKKTMDIIYYKKDDEGGTLMENGAPVIDTGKTTSTSIDNWVTNIIGTKFTGDDKGKVNNLVSEIMRTGFDWDLQKFADVYGTAPDNNRVVTDEKKRTTTTNSSGIKWR